MATATLSSIAWPRLFAQCRRPRTCPRVTGTLRRIPCASPTGPHALALIEGEQKRDHERDFVTPVYKLFEGQECLPGISVSLSFMQRHVGDKLKRAAQAKWGVTVPPSTNLDAPPFTMTSSGQAGDTVTLVRSGSAVLVMPTPLPLIESVQAGIAPIYSFKVPRQWPWLLEIVNRRYTTMRIVNSLFRVFLAGIDEVRQLYFPHFAPNWLRYPEPRNAPELSISVTPQNLEPRRR